VLQANQVSLQRGSLKVFSDLSFTVYPGHKVGLVGRNGAGKSTVFALLTGELQADAGELSAPADWQIAHMAQHVELSDRTALDYVVDGHVELRAVEQKLAALHAADDADPLQVAELHTRLDDLGGHQAEARAGEILYGLGFSGADFSRPYREFSGGMRIRLNLAQTLMTPCDLLLLDEPTNHLDLETTMWLESWLQRYAGTLLLIAHDRRFLDQVCTEIVHLDHGQATTYRGSYSDFERQRAAVLSQRQAAFARQQQEIEHMHAFIDRFRAKASKAKQAQSRLKALQRMETVAAVHADSPYKLTFTAPPKMSNPLLRLDRVAIGYGDSPILSDINASILPGARIGILGANGAGKSTLLKCLVGELPPCEGELSFGRNAPVGYFAQHQLETLDADISALETLIRLRPQQREQWCRDYLGGWGFSASLAERAIQTLSGGEKARLVLALIALEQPALLVLDEPTNHLDLDMREALALALQDYAGALLLVSHDRSLLERAVDEFWLVADGKVREYSEDLDTYTSTPAGVAKGPSGKKAARQAAATRRQREKPFRDRVRKLEASIEQISQDLRTTEAKLADADVYARLPANELDTLLARAGKLRKSLEADEHAWLEACEALENLGEERLN
jgi:ATP-binding cassette subfamily F protein 3